MNVPIQNRRFTLDDEPVPDILAFIEENALGDDDQVAIGYLGVEEEMEFGGGAGATLILRRTA